MSATLERAACIDLEGVLVPEMWPYVAKRTGIDAFLETTRETPDYPSLMAKRIVALKSHGLKLADVQTILSEITPFPDSADFLSRIGERYSIRILSDCDVAKGEKISREQYEQALTARTQLLAQFKDAFSQVDALITPTMPTTAPVLAAGGPAYDRGREFMLPISWTGLPALSTQSGFDSNGLPVGMQLIGNSRQEARLLQIAHTHQKATGFYLKPPPVYA